MRPRRKRGRTFVPPLAPHDEAASSGRARIRAHRRIDRAAKSRARNSLQVCDQYQTPVRRLHDRLGGLNAFGDHATTSSGHVGRRAPTASYQRAPSIMATPFVQRCERGDDLARERVREVHSLQVDNAARDRAEKERRMAHEQHRECIEACQKCADECEHCASACLREDNVKMMAECIQLDRDCADLCRLAAALMSRGSRIAAEFCQLCATVCDACAAECERHEMEHCKRCAAACRQCADECRKMAVAGGARGRNRELR